MSAITVSPAYSALLLRFPPRVIRSEEQNESYIEVLHQLEGRQSEWSSEEEDLAALLTLLVEDFEDKQYRIPKSSPLETLTFLMDQHGLHAEELAQVLGGNLSGPNILKADHIFTAQEIASLSRHFHVSPEIFF